MISPSPPMPATAAGPGVSRRHTVADSATSPPAPSSHARDGSEKNAHGGETRVKYTASASAAQQQIAAIDEKIGEKYGLQRPLLPVMPRVARRKKLPRLRRLTRKKLKRSEAGLVWCKDRKSVV